MSAPTQARTGSQEAVGSPYAYLNGKILPLAEANVSIATHALQYGTGVFEGIRGYHNPDTDELFILQAQAHYERFVQSCRILRLDVGMSPAELTELTAQLLRRCGYRTDVYIRPFAFKADPVIKVKLSGLTTGLGIYVVPMGDYVATDGLKVQVSGWRRLSDNAIPSRAKVTGSYVNAALAVDDALAAGFDEAILLNEDGHVAEASSANLFMVRRGTLITPPVTDGILEGITRNLLFELAHERGIATQERSIDRSELYVADEIFFCGTGAQLAPVVEVDRRPVGSGTIGPIASALQSAYGRACRGQDPTRMHWLTPVFGTSSK